MIIKDNKLNTINNLFCIKLALNTRETQRLKTIDKNANLILYYNSILVD